MWFMHVSPVKHSQLVQPTTGMVPWAHSPLYYLRIPEPCWA